MPETVFCNLIVIRSYDLDRAAIFYTALGLTLVRHAHGSGPNHLAHEANGQVFEIYPLEDGEPATTATRIGFSVPSVDKTYTSLLDAGGQAVLSPRKSPWSRRAVVSDPDGHRVELTELGES
ncbi:VOC family protein [Lacunimicrobium album]